MTAIAIIPFILLAIQTCDCVTTEEEEAKILSEIESDLVALRTELEILKSYVKLGTFAELKFLSPDLQEKFSYH